MDHYRATGQADQVRAIRIRLDRHDEELVQAQRERTAIRPGDELLPHELTGERLEALRSLLAARPDCGAAWLARKKLRYFPRRPLFILCVRGPSSPWWFRGAEHDRALVRRLIPLVELPGQVLVIARQGAFRSLARQVMRLPGTAVFRRDEHRKTRS